MKKEARRRGANSHFARNTKQKKGDEILTRGAQLAQECQGLGENRTVGGGGRQKVTA